jgi:predicted component of type VI protein secretion system
MAIAHQNRPQNHMHGHARHEEREKEHESLFSHKKRQRQVTQMSHDLRLSEPPASRNVFSVE